MELKNIAWELHEIHTSFNSWLNQVKERKSEIEDQLNEMKQEDKNIEKEWKDMSKASKKYGIMWKDQIYVWSVYLKVMGRMKPSWKTLFRILSRRTSPTEQGRPTFKFRKYREHHKDTPQEEQPQNT